MAFCIVEIPANVRIAYKIFPGQEISLEHALSGQGQSDWSALYGQFSLSHAIAYLPNHFDRGATAASLMSIITRKVVRCFAYIDPRYGCTALSSSEKAQLLRDCISVNVSSSLTSCKPLLQSIGEDLNMFVAMLDAEEIECAFPHCMMNLDNFTYHTIATFTAGSGSALVSNANVVNQLTGERETIQLSKTEKIDMASLADRIEIVTGLTNCNWFDSNSMSLSTHLKC